MKMGRLGHTASVLSNGNVLVTGGNIGTGYVNTNELYDLSTKKMDKC